MADATDCIDDAAQKAPIAQVQAVPGQKVPGEMLVGQDIHCFIVRSYGGQLSVDAGDLPVSIGTENQDAIPGRENSTCDVLGGLCFSSDSRSLGLQRCKCWPVVIIAIAKPCGSWCRCRNRGNCL